ncbi:Uma2 family endonuclease [Mariniblastus sp.]|nr:Uma2 family endonuclease [Mariniblastus sp.]
MSTAPKSRLTPAEYLEIERAAEARSEYFGGEMFAMSGASRAHNRISANILRRIDEQLDGRPCEVFMSDMRVKVNAVGLYTYPDVVATCENPEFEDAEVDTLLNPQVIIEVLSKSTEGYDRGKKFENYQKLKSLKEFLLVSQTSPRVERYTRQSDNEWLLWTTGDVAGSVEIKSIDCELRLVDIFAKVQFLPTDG